MCGLEQTGLGVKFVAAAYDLVRTSMLIADSKPEAPVFDYCAVVEMRLPDTCRESRPGLGSTPSQIIWLR